MKKKMLCLFFLLFTFLLLSFYFKNDNHISNARNQFLVFLLSFSLAPIIHCYFVIQISADNLCIKWFVICHWVLRFWIYIYIYCQVTLTAYIRLGKLVCVLQTIGKKTSLPTVFPSFLMRYLHSLTDYIFPNIISSITGGVASLLSGTHVFPPCCFRSLSEIVRISSRITRKLQTRWIGWIQCSRDNKTF